MSQTDVEQEYYCIMANSGTALEAAAHARGVPVVLSHIAVGDGNGQVPAHTQRSESLVHEVYRREIDSRRVDDEDKNITWISMLIPADTGGFWIREFAVYAQPLDEGGEPVLYAIGTHAPYYKTSKILGQATTHQLEIPIIMSGAAEVEIQVRDAGYATQEALENVASNIAGKGLAAREKKLDVLTDNKTVFINDANQLYVYGLNKLYDMGDGELNLYVRPDGNDENDGLADAPERAWKTIDHVTKWLNERKFTGKGWITVHVANGTYVTDVGEKLLNCSSAQFVDGMSSFPVGPRDPISPESWRGIRIAFIGNVDKPDSVRYVIPSSFPLTYFAPANCGVYGMTLAIEAGISSQIRGSIVGGLQGYETYLGNIILEAGPDTGVAFSPYSAVRGSGNIYMYGSMRIRANNEWLADQLFSPNTGGSFNFGHYASNCGNGPDMYNIIPLDCVIESEVRSRYTYCGADTRSPTMGYVRGQGSQIRAENPSGQRYILMYSNIFESAGAGVNFFPGLVDGEATPPANLYI